MSACPLGCPGDWGDGMSMPMGIILSMPKGISPAIIRRTVDSWLTRLARFRSKRGDGRGRAGRAKPRVDVDGNGVAVERIIWFPHQVDRRTGLAKLANHASSILEPRPGNYGIRPLHGGSENPFSAHICLAGPGLSRPMGIAIVFSPALKIIPVNGR